MKNKLFCVGMAALLLSFGLVLTGCGDKDDDGGNTDPKTLVITGITSAQATLGQQGIQIGIFQNGISTEAALQMVGIVAGADSDSVTLSGSTVTALLYEVSQAEGPTSTRWTGSGTYDVYLILGSETSSIYKASVSFNSTTTTVSATSFSTPQ